jgi:hypothetical protein
MGRRFYVDRVRRPRAVATFFDMKRSLLLLLALSGCPGERSAPVAVAPTPAPPVEAPPPAPDTAPPEPAPQDEVIVVPPPRAPTTPTATEAKPFDPFGGMLDESQLLGAVADELAIDEVDPTIGRPVDRSRPPPTATSAPAPGTSTAPRPRPTDPLVARVEALLARTPPAQLDRPAFEALAREVAAELETARRAGRLTMDAAEATMVGFVRVGTHVVASGKMSMADLEPIGATMAAPIRTAMADKTLNTAELKRRYEAGTRAFLETLR